MTAPYKFFPSFVNYHCVFTCDYYMVCSWPSSRIWVTFTLQTITITKSCEILVLTTPTREHKASNISPKFAITGNLFRNFQQNSLKNKKQQFETCMCIPSFVIFYTMLALLLVLHDDIHIRIWGSAKRVRT